MTEIEGKVVAITGAGSGIGEATALLLAERGAKVVLGARRVERLEDLAKRIIGAGGEAAFAPTDVTRRQDLVNLVDVARERFGRLDVLVGNAGVATVAPLDELRVDAWDQMVDVNLKGVLHGIAAALPVFRAQGSGQFVTIASTSAYRTVPGQAVYSATKVAVCALCEGLRQEAGDSLRVTIVSPGMTRTEFVEGAPEPMRAMVDKVAIGPDAIARAVAFAVGQPADVDVNEVVVRPTAQS
ncbi:NADP-dependent 3-hydroxy acid dehydrogenase YdfG [Amycolatopsis bartoniae]|uniref:Oxidoreductase n=1 Tax=Amycolatopsis bartoniae TaxID=941986 RepID=A0A8H9J1N2_9PSEU|nr:SDR family oxidoreductase [Amycolatopsis bartoniae]MBB2934008.1 NADP-dependent 3-hydroxy acid dehydrogenase YdfG [Amycolatopsis bartoniae]TVT00231.1 SDR family oxidoreductase [Amycolatopsis bartoniae]GHF85939.1 oxidoreductase [Amycolatopsis bartoniae]